MKKVIIFLVFVFIGYSFASAQESVPAKPTMEVQQIQPVPVTQQAQPTPLQIQEPTQKIQPPSKDFNDDNGENEFADPQQVRDALRQLKDLTRETKRILKMAKKFPNLESEVGQLNEINSKLLNFGQIFQSGKVDRDTMQEFWDAQYWDTINTIRGKVELPDEIKRIEKDLNRLLKLVGKSTFVIEGVDMGAVKAKIDEVKSSVAQAKDNYAQGNYEDARENLQIVYEGGSSPGEIMGILQQLNDMTKRMKRMKPDVKAEFQDFLSPIFEAVGQGDFHEANMMFGEINRDLFRMMDSLRSSSAVSDKFKVKMQELEQKMNQRIQQDEQQKQNRPESYYPVYQPYRSASLLGNVYDRVMEFFGQ